MPPDNIRPFPTSKKAKQWPERLTIAGYLLLLAVLFQSPSGESINLFMLLGLAYWALRHQKRWKLSYFVRYQILMGLLSFLMLTILFLLLQSFISLVFSLLGLVGVSALLSGASGVVAIFLANAPLVCVAGLTLFLLINALLGRCPHVPVVSDNVRYWA